MSNMESMLLGGDDDSSSGESGDEVDVPSRNTTAVTTATVPPRASPTGPKTSASVPPRADPLPSPAPVAASGNGTNNQVNARLKNLYSQNKRPTPQPGAPIPAPTAPTRLNSGPKVSQTRPQSQPLPPPSTLGQVQPSQRTHGAPIMKPNQPSQYNRSIPYQSRQQHTGRHDPFAPTPLAKIKPLQQQPIDPHQRSRPSTSQTQGYSSRQGTGPSGGSQQDRAATIAAREQEVRRQKEKFLVFTRVLIKYLEQKDPNLHRQAKAIIKDCAERNKRQEPGYTSVTASMKTRLRQLVGENYWKRAEAYLKHYLEQRASSSSSQQAQQARQKQIARQKQQQQLQRQQYAQRSGTSISSVQQEIANRKNDIARGTAGTATNISTAATMGGKESVGKVGKKQAATKRKGGASTTPTSRKAGSGGGSAKEVQDNETEELPKEYFELMAMVDHAIDYDWTTAGQLITPNSDLKIDEEQRKFLYGESKPTPPPPPEVSGPRPGWDKKNVFSARAAWARVRLGEQKAAQKAPVVAGGLITLPTNNELTPTNTGTTWINEEIAEHDVTLAMLSEGCQQYLRGILEKAVYCARQRQNVDGIRLWHQQHTASEDNKPSLSLRLGCDVSRQVAQVAGNSAMICKRMEEALERQSGVPSSARALEETTLEEATSMSDLALRPKLAKGVESADQQAREDFERYGGKYSSEPPLGRIPKRAKIETSDLIMGSNLLQATGRHRASTASVTAFY